MVINARNDYTHHSIIKEVMKLCIKSKKYKVTICQVNFFFNDMCLISWSHIDTNHSINFVSLGLDMLIK